MANSPHHIQHGEPKGRAVHVEGPRRALWYRLVESPAIELLRAGSEAEASDLASKLIDEEAANSR